MVGFKTLSSDTAKKQKGFTIVELLIVIVVIGILAALVLNTFSGVQRRARDTQRRTDVNSLATQLEVYYNDNGGYPLAANVTTTALKGLDAGALVPPTSTQTAVKGVSAAATTGTGGLAHATDLNPATTNEQYGYWPLQSNGTTTCTTAPCAKFRLYYVTEDGTLTLQTKNSLN